MDSVHQVDTEASYSGARLKTSEYESSLLA